MARGASSSYAVVLRSLIDSRRWNSVGPTARELFVRVLLKADDAGLYHGEPVLIRSKLFGLLDVHVDQIAHGLAELVHVELLRLYRVDGERFVWVANHATQLRADRRPRLNFPAPPDGYPVDPKRPGFEQRGDGWIATSGPRAEWDPAPEEWLSGAGSQPIDGRDSVGSQAGGIPWVPPSPSPSPSPSPTTKGGVGGRAHDSGSLGSQDVGRPKKRRRRRMPPPKPTPARHFDERFPPDERDGEEPAPKRGAKLKALSCEQAWRLMADHLRGEGWEPSYVERLSDTWRGWWEEARMRSRPPKSSEETWRRRVRELGDLGPTKLAFLVDRARDGGWQGLRWSHVAREWAQIEREREKAGGTPSGLLPGVAEDDGGSLPPARRRE